jgi:hypothetical protein
LVGALLYLPKGMRIDLVELVGLANTVFEHNGLERFSERYGRGGKREGFGVVVGW